MPPSDNGAVLTDVTQSMANATIKDEAASQRTREHGWSKPEKYDYKSYNARTREEQEAVEAGHELPAWASNAIKYEWKDEYGDLAPEHKELEKMLFQDQNRMESGIKFDMYLLIFISYSNTRGFQKLTYLFRLTGIAVTVESDAKVKPVATVMTVASPFPSQLTVIFSSKTLGYIRSC